MRETLGVTVIDDSFKIIGPFRERADHGLNISPSDNGGFSMSVGRNYQ